MKKILNVVLYMWVMLVDFTILISVYALINKLCLLGFDTSEMVAYIVSTVAALVSFIHLKSRAKIRAYQAELARQKQVEIFSSMDDDSDDSEK